jgi:hypothetical protein
MPSLYGIIKYMFGGNDVAFGFADTNENASSNNAKNLVFALGLNNP